MTFQRGHEPTAEKPLPLAFDTTNPEDSKPWMVVEPLGSGPFVPLRELWQGRDILYFLVLRELKTRYAYSVLGYGWTILGPLFTALVLAVTLGQTFRIAEGQVHYGVYCFAALVPWTYFSGAVTDATRSLLNNPQLVLRAYLPRAYLPLTPILSRLVDLAASSAVLLLFLAWYGVSSWSSVLVLPLLVLIMIVTALGWGLWLSMLAVDHRDVAYGVSFLLQLLLFATPVLFPLSSLPKGLLPILALNPMVGVVTGFCSTLKGSDSLLLQPLILGGFTSMILFLTGMWFFYRREPDIADLL